MTAVPEGQGLRPYLEEYADHRAAAKEFIDHSTQYLPDSPERVAYLTEALVEATLAVAAATAANAASRT